LRTAIYIDGFNLYYRALKNTPYKWVNLYQLAQDLLEPYNEIVALKYYTARVSGRTDPDQPKRQQLYLNALKTLPNTSIHYGRFLSKTKMRPLVTPPLQGSRFVEIYDTEEKGSDVNLATHLIHDGWRDLYDVAVLFSQDTDLIEPVRIVREEIGKVIGIVHLDGAEPGSRLKRTASFVKHLTSSRLSAAQFPARLMGRNGRYIDKPSAWN